MWKDRVTMRCRWKTNSVICCDLLNDCGRVSWNMVACYGTPYLGEKDDFQKNLEERMEYLTSPWMILGDLNEMVNANEKMGGTWRSI